MIRLTGCNCGSANYNKQAGGVLRTTPARLNEAGMYDTFSAPECETPYAGALMAASVYVVDLGGPSEAFFLRSDRAAAVNKARTEHLTIAHLPAYHFCSEVMLELLGA